MARLRSLVWSSITALLLLAQHSTAASSFTLEQVMSAPFASHLLPAPKGERVVWLINEQGKRNLWTAGAPDWHGRKLTHFDEDDGQEIDELDWSPDGREIFFARGGDFENGHEVPNPALNPERPAQAIWSVSIDGSVAKKLTDGRAPAVSPNGDIVVFLRGGQVYSMKPTGEEVKPLINEKSPADLSWSPDGTRLAYVSERGDHSFIGVYTMAAKNLIYLDPSVDRDADATWSPDSAHIVFVRRPAENRPFAFGPERAGQPWSIRMADVKTGSGHQIFAAREGQGSVFHRLDAEQQLFWSASNKIVFPWEATGWCHLYSVALAGGQAQELTPGEGEVENAALSDDRRTLYYAANISDIDRRHIWQLAFGESNQPPKMLTRGDGIQVRPTPLAGGSEIALLDATYRESVHAALRSADGQVKSLAPETVPADFPASALIRPESVTITAADGLELQGQLFLPSDAKARRHPALVFFHGGSRRQMLLGFHYMYYYSNAYAMNQYLASRGYVVLSINYRSGIGYGLNFREAIHYGATGASEYNDVIGAGLYLKSRADVDGKQIGVWGGSYGGYLTALALARASNLFAAGVDFHGVHDWNLEIENFVPAYDPKGQAEAAKIAFESSPLSSVSTWKSPVLLIHGDDDRNVPFTETVRLAEALRQQHVPFEELIFPNEIHDFLLYRHWVEAYTATANFFARQLRAEPASSARSQ